MYIVLLSVVLLCVVLLSVVLLCVVWLCVVLLCVVLLYVILFCLASHYYYNKVHNSSCHYFFSFHFTFNRYITKRAKSYYNELFDGHMFSSISQVFFPIIQMHTIK